MPKTCIPTMNKKRIAITGANSGIGLEAARELAKRGHEIIMICRSRERGEQARKELISDTGNAAIHLELCDLSLMRNIHEFGPAFAKRYAKLDVLINNAGAIFGQRSETEEGLERTFALNHIGYFLLSHYLLPSLEQSDEGRIVNVSSEAHRMAKVDFDDLQYKDGYSQWRAYGDSKLYNILFTRALSRKVKAKNITVNALHPGFVYSNFGDQAKGFFKWIYPILRLFMISAEKGAQTSIYLADAPGVKGITGEYFSKKRSKKTSKAAYDKELAEKLWKESLRITGVKDYLSPNFSKNS